MIQLGHQDSRNPKGNMMHEHVPGQRTCHRLLLMVGKFSFELDK